ncbi:MAG: hypothetical protein BRD48_02605 [Bacteroidetes bacterium QS_9_68_14]|nr:MAG: hypothetical protein BRD48_02605 [Bacteroidetes bacterium QS_9_68_14]
MADRDRRGMLIKNTDTESVRVPMATRILHIGPGEETFITAEEVRDPVLRDSLQHRAIAIVRPATEEESADLEARLAEEEDGEE